MGSIYLFFPVQIKLHVLFRYSYPRYISLPVDLKPSRQLYKIFFLFLISLCRSIHYFFFHKSDIQVCEREKEREY